MATNIKDKIAKLLALAESPNENEAKAALLKARELMAEHKLRPEDVKKAKKEKVIRKVLDITCTAMTNPWAASLSAVVAEHYCCRAYRYRSAGSKKNKIGLVGEVQRLWLGVCPGSEQGFSGAGRAAPGMGPCDGSPSSCG